MFKTFVINLDKDTQRMEFMDAQLVEAGILYQRKSAILGREYVPTHDEYDERIAKETSGYVMSLGELGCALSHAQVIEEIVRERIPYALILEDDVTIPSNFLDIIEKAIKENKSWEYLSFDYIPVGMPFFKQWLVGVRINYKKKIGIRSKIVFGITHLIKGLYIFLLSMFEKLREIIKRSNPGPVTFYRPVYFAGAYLVTYDGAKKLHSLTKPIIYTADQLPNKARVLRKLAFRCFSPLIVSQEKQRFGSSILDIKGEDVHLAYKNNH